MVSGENGVIRSYEKHKQAKQKNTHNASCSRSRAFESSELDYAHEIKRHIGNNGKKDMRNSVETKTARSVFFRSFGSHSHTHSHSRGWNDEMRIIT